MKFTKSFMVRNSGCYSYKKLMDCSFMKNEEITAESILNSEIPLKDKFWFFCRKVFTKEQNQKITIQVAESVLPIWENRYPEDLTPRQAIEAAKQYIAGRVSLDFLTKRRFAAAYAAYAAAYAAAAYAAAYAAAAAAAAAADAAADAAAYAAAAAAAAAAADADAYAAADVKIQNQLLEILKSFVNES